LVLNLLLLTAIAILSLTYPVEELSRRLGDAFFRLRGHQGTSAAVALVLIDDASLEHYGRWPWSRTQVARLIRGVSTQRASSIGLDILLSEPADTKGDSDLALAIREAGNVVLAAKLSSAGDQLWAEPLPIFRDQAAGVGHVQAVMDPDGIARRVPLMEVSASGPRWPVAVEMARIATGQPVEVDGNELKVGNNRIWAEGRPHHGQGKGWNAYSAQFLLVDFRRQLVPGEVDPPFVAIPAASILEGQAPDSLYGKNVLIGFGASDLGDRIPTPVSRQTPMPGVEVHANLLEEILAGHAVRHAGLVPQVGLVVVYCLVSTWLVLRRPGWGSVWTALGLLVASFGIGLLLFTRYRVLLDFGPLVCAAFLAVPMAQLENLVIVNRALNRGLKQLRSTLLSGGTDGRITGVRTDASKEDSTRYFSEKLDLIGKLQSELSSLYTFRQNLLESMQEGLAVFDATGKMEFRNRFWERFCLRQGWNPTVELREFGQLLGHPQWSELEQQLSDGSLPLESEVYLGGGFWQVRAIRMEAERSSGTQWMVVVTDLTSRLERDQARGEALRFVTHELRTPLVSIQGFAESLLRYSPEGSREAATIIFGESQRLVSLINTYLDVLRFDAGARSLRNEPIVIPQMVAQVEKIMAPIADSGDIGIHVELDSTLPMVYGDPPMLTGVLLNLLNNAVKYSPEKSEVAVHVYSDNTSVIFEVRNPGPPIAPEHLSRFFEPFYRAQEHETAEPGWGLGLTFVKRIVEEHHGTIEATSNEQGIRVMVRIPRASGKLGLDLGHGNPSGGAEGPKGAS
jgi:signal transduction histidine kinase